MNGVLDDESFDQQQKMLSDIRSGIRNHECTILVNYPNDTHAWYKVSVSPQSDHRPV